ncbi:hypothetical protein ACW9HR_35865 [Nocardia gipuzkoensis]
MPEQQILWTALPRGADDSYLYLDVFVSPRLGIGAETPRFTLSEFPDFEHWTHTLAEQLSFQVELGNDGIRHPTDVIRAELDHDAWGHLFRASTFVRPWHFKDLSDVAIYSYSVRFVTAYLTNLYRTTGRRHPNDPPAARDLADLADTLGPITDIRVDEERRPPPREPDNYPTPAPAQRPRPGCTGFLWRSWRRLCRFLQRLLSRLLASWFGLPSRRRPARTPKVATPPTVVNPPVRHPSPYRDRAPLAPAHLPALDELERRMRADRVIGPSTSLGSMADALAVRDITFDFARVKRFYERPESKVANPVRPTVPELDFHQALGALGDYPALLRALGLVVRLRIPRPTTDPEVVRVIPRWDEQTRTSDVCPATHTIGPPGFTAAGRPSSHLHGGLLDLRGTGDRLVSDTPKFDIVQVDTDGAAIKALNLAATLERRRQLDRRAELGIDRREREALASLRSGGLALVWPDRAAYLHNRLVAAADLAVPVRLPGSSPDDPYGLPSGLFAEDLLRGYRIQVSTDGGPWLSLGKRVGTYRLVDDDGRTVRVLPPIADEGYVKGTSGTRTTGDENPLYVHEVLARWTGWSLAAPRPGLTIENRLVDEPPEHDEPYDRPRLPQSTAETEFRLIASFVPSQGSLPRLRFGRSYRMRVVGVDLAGEPITEPDDSDPAVSEQVIFRRFEPAGPPAVLALRRYLPGESLERLVLRSDGQISNPEYDLDFLGPAENDATAQRTRHLFPPKTAQLMAESHGRFDISFTGPDGTPGDPNAGYRLALRESGTLNDPKVIDVNNVDIDRPQPTIEAGEPKFIPPTGHSEHGGYWINRSNTTLPTPYLPDPLAVGVALRGLPGLFDPNTGESHSPTGDPLPPVVPGRPPLLQVPFTGDWPDLEPLRIRMAEAPRDQPQPPPHWEAAHRLLTVFLPQATATTILYSSYIGGEGLDIHALWDIIDDGDAQLRAQAASGAHWMFSPARPLTLVHAVQHPLPHRDRALGIEAPAYLPTFTAERNRLDETRAELRGSIRLDRASTGRIEIIARWNEWLDDETHGVIQRPQETVAFSATVDPTWIDYNNFPQGSEPVFQEFGDTRHRQVRYLVRATSRFREYLAPDLDTDQLTTDSNPADVAEVNVLSSARPPKPAVLYAMPAVEWRPPREISPDTRVFQRRGGALRVYLGRPWHLSGEGELLGVLLQTNADNPLPDGFRTRYGADAIWARRPSRRNTVTELRPEHFLNRVPEATESELTVPGLPGGLTATVIGFRPEYNQAQKLWYADIEIDMENMLWTYWPFVQLAFVRYQPNSLDAAKVSRVVLGEFGQLAPERALSLIRDSETQVTAILRGRAPHLPVAPRVAFRVQQAPNVPTPPDELDWTHVEGPAPDIDAASFHELVAPADADGDGRASWTKTIDIPTSDNRLRLEVAEYELLHSDSEFGKGGIIRMTYAVHVDLD